MFQGENAEDHSTKTRRKTVQKHSLMLATIALGAGVNTMPAIAQEPVNQGDLSFSFGATTTSAYFFRGYK